MVLANETEMSIPMHAVKVSHEPRPVEAGESAMRIATVYEHQGHRWSIEPIVPSNASCSQSTGSQGSHCPEQATWKATYELPDAAPRTFFYCPVHGPDWKYTHIEVPAMNLVS
jgi:hypothetical protein